MSKKSSDLRKRDDDYRGEKDDDDSTKNSKKKQKRLVQTKLDIHFSFTKASDRRNKKQGSNETPKRRSSSAEKDGIIKRRENLAAAALMRATSPPSIDDDDEFSAAAAGSSSNKNNGHHFWEEVDTIDSFVSASSTENSPPSTAVPENNGGVEEDNMGSVTSLGAKLESLRRETRRLPKLRATASSHDNSYYHTVLFDTSGNSAAAVLENDGRHEEPPKPYPRRFWDKWDGEHVRMPCSSRSEYPVVDEAELVQRWTVVREALTTSNTSWTTFEDLKRAILSYNGGETSKNRWNFAGLQNYIESMEDEEREALFSHTLPAMARLALDLPDSVTHPIPLLKRGHRGAVTMTQRQAACLLANAFFCTFPRRNRNTSSNHHRGSSEYENYSCINFQALFGPGKEKMAKLDFVFHYFRRVAREMPIGVLTFERTSLDVFPDWALSISPICGKIHVSKKGTIEDFGEGMLQVDFANKFLGGGVLGYGSVQEEIRFLICPELIISMLCAESLDDNECFFMTGCERFSYYTGYGRSLQWLKSFEDTTSRDEWGRRRVQVVAMDAIPFSNSEDQFQKSAIDRELNKAYCAFAGRPGMDAEFLSPVATGNWGCGAFGGDKELKFLIQLMAASESGRDLAYFTFDDASLMRGIYEIYQLLLRKANSVGCVYDLLIRYCKYRHSESDDDQDHRHNPRMSVFEFIRKSI